MVHAETLASDRGDGADLAVVDPFHPGADFHVSCEKSVVNGQVRGTVAGCHREIVTPEGKG